MPSNTHEKRASFPRASDYTKTFHKDWHRLTRSGRYNMKLLKEVMLLLIANDEPLGAEWKDHALAGNWVFLPKPTNRTIPVPRPQCRVQE